MFICILYLNKFLRLFNRLSWVHVTACFFFLFPPFLFDLGLTPSPGMAVYVSMCGKASTEVVPIALNPPHNEDLSAGHDQCVRPNTGSCRLVWLKHTCPGSSVPLLGHLSPFWDASVSLSSTFSPGLWKSVLFSGSRLANGTDN